MSKGSGGKKPNRAKKKQRERRRLFRGGKVHDFAVKRKKERLQKVKSKLKAKKQNND